MDDPVLQPGFCVGPGGGEVGENESVCIRTIGESTGKAGTTGEKVESIVNNI